MRLRFEAQTEPEGRRHEISKVRRRIGRSARTAGTNIEKEVVDGPVPRDAPTCPRAERGIGGNC